MGTRRLRIAAAVLILAGLAFIAASLLPVYFDNFRLQQFVADIALEARAAPPPDAVLRVRVLDKAAALGLPMQPGNVMIRRSAEGVRIDVRYVVRVSFPLYTVDLHFYPGAGSR
ncbi:MAG: hypothetical protein ACRD8O_03850 [Bryobacteraceae bacterium]